MKNLKREEAARRDFGLTLKKRREDMGRSRKYLADLLGLSPEKIQEVEEGNNDSLILLFSICDALEINVFLLIGGEELNLNNFSIKDAVFEDAYALSLLHKDTFRVPSNEDLKGLKVGDLVKVCSCGERFWAKIKFVAPLDRKIIALIDNDLISKDEHGLQYGDLVSFGFHNVYSID